MKPEQMTAWLVEQARGVGFDLCGVAPVEDYAELGRLPEWLARGYSGEMSYLHDARRHSPARVLDGARALIVCALNYNTPLPYSTEVAPLASSGAAPGPTEADAHSCSGGPRGWISRYAWGDDYHPVMLGKLEALVAKMRQGIAEPFEARAYVDTGPIAERIAAKYAGLGWLAKNTLLIHPELGSWLFLGVILTTLDLAASLGPVESPPPDLCGNCRLCIEACPTGAIVEPYVLDARRCISYLTIELHSPIPVEFREAMGRHVFGCDICQDVCPWNRRAPASGVEAFLPRRRKTRSETRDAQRETSEFAPRADDSSLFAPELEWLAGLSEEEFREVFRGSAVKRTKWRGLVRNACVALGNAGLRPAKKRGDVTAYERVVVLLERLAASGDAVIAEHARWALGRLREHAE